MFPSFFFFLFQIDLVLSLEGMLKSFDLHHLFLFPPIPMRYGPIDINMPNSFSDHYYTTGQEIAEVIKPRPVSLFCVHNAQVLTSCSHWHIDVERLCRVIFKVNLLDVIGIYLATPNISSECNWHLISVFLLGPYCTTKQGLLTLWWGISTY